MRGWWKDGLFEVPVSRILHIPSHILISACLRYLEFLFIEHVFPEWDYWMFFLGNIYHLVLLIDMDPSRTHPVERDVQHPREVCLGPTDLVICWPGLWSSVDWGTHTQSKGCCRRSLRSCD